MPRTANPVQLQKYLKGTDYPAGGKTLPDRARRKGADENMIFTLEKLPDKEYGGPAGTTGEIGKMRQWRRRESRESSRESGEPDSIGPGTTCTSGRARGRLLSSFEAKAGTLFPRRAGGSRGDKPCPPVVSYPGRVTRVICPFFML